MNLLSKLLDLDATIVTDKISDLLMNPLVVQVLLGFIARVPYEFNYDDIEANQSLPRADPPLRRTDNSTQDETKLTLESVRRPMPITPMETEAVRRSFNAMTLLISPSPRSSLSILSLLREHFSTILLRLLSVFHFSSHGNFFHASALLTKLITTSPQLFIQTLINSKAAQQLFLLAFNHLHEAAVPHTILSILSPSEATKDVKLNLLRFIRDSPVLSKLVTRLCSPHNQYNVIISESIQDFFLLYLEKVRTADFLTSWLAEVCKPKTGLVEALCRVICGREPTEEERGEAEEGPELGKNTKSVGLLYRPEQCAQATNVLSALIASAETKTVLIADPNDSGAAARSSAREESLFANKKVPNPMFALRSKFTTTLKPHVSELARALVGGEEEMKKAEEEIKKRKSDKEQGKKEEEKNSTPSSSSTSAKSLQLSGYTVTTPFSSSRLSLLRLLARICSMSSSSLLDLPLPVWSVLTSWFFLYPHNAFFLSEFRSLFLSLLRCSCGKEIITIGTDAALKEGGEEVRKQYEDVLKQVIGDEVGLLEKMCKQYKITKNSSQTTSANSFILEITTHLRLTSSLLPSNFFLPTYLASSSTWKDFLPLLTAESIKQSAEKFPVPQAGAGGSDIELFRAISGLPPSVLAQLGGQFAQLAAAAQKAEEQKLLGGPESKYGKEGIEIGSFFAFRYGYEQVVEGVGKDKKISMPKKPATNLITAPASGLGFGAGAGAGGKGKLIMAPPSGSSSSTTASANATATATAATSAAKAKKNAKKKAKKKAKAAAAAATGEKDEKDEKDEDEDDEDDN